MATGERGHRDYWEALGNSAGTSEGLIGHEKSGVRAALLEPRSAKVCLPPLIANFSLNLF